MRYINYKEFMKGTFLKAGKDAKGFHEQIKRTLRLKKRVSMDIDCIQEMENGDIEYR